jgi:hypothetical protein
MNDTNYRIALTLLERTGAYLNFFLSIEAGEKFTEPQENALKFMQEIVDFLKKVGAM